ncbi:serine dehydratase subunit alpha family protein, partial [Lachnospiraceae bacterium OttesenSCG-928-E19]|nr:serine dehydratase subunit alpha family protein [Lachnospiraceae bacterium OttesenSCG-928-E19]
MNQLTMLIKDDMKPALGVTEPGAIAFATAKARDNAKGKIKSLKVSLNSGMYKNAFTCGIPNSDGKGNQFAAALGVIAGDASLGLEALAYITDEDNQRAKLLIEEGKVEVILDHMGSEITIDVRLETENDVVVVRIARGHTEIYEITKNNKVIFEKELQDKQLKAQVDIHKFSFHDIIEYVRTVDGNELEFIEEAFSMNMELLYSGLESSKTTFGPQLLKQNHNQIISKDGLATAQLLCNGALEARVLGLN